MRWSHFCLTLGNIFLLTFGNILTSKFIKFDTNIYVHKCSLGSTCNHVAAVLFKVEHAWRNGWTNPACTSRPCEWNQFGAKATVEPKKIKDMEWRKPYYKKQGMGQAINPMKRQLFNPTDSERIKAPSSTLSEIVNAMYASCSKACIFEYVDLNADSHYPVESDINIAVTVDVETSDPAPLCIKDLAKASNSLEMFMNSLPNYTPNQVNAIELSTKGQSDSNDWLKYRTGMVTASVIRTVESKVQTLTDTESHRSKETTGLLEKLCSKSKSSDLSHIPAIKYGKLTEPEARAKYQQVLKKLGHANVKVKETGLFVMPDKIYIGASPDGIVSCSCCAKGLLEIKCPLSIAHDDPEKANLSYLIRDTDGILKLKRSHQYYSQVITQLGITQLEWCDFFVYTRNGHVLERIYQDQVRWTKLVSASTFFFEKYKAPYLLSLTVEPSSTALSPSQSVEVTEQHVDVTSSVSNITDLPVASTHTRRQHKRKKPKMQPVFVCGTCKKECMYAYEIDTDSGNSILCEMCKSWFHWGCVSVDAENDLESDWFCSDCMPTGDR